MSANSITGEIYDVGDDYTITGYVQSINGTGSTAILTVQTRIGDIFSVIAGQVSAPQTEGPALSRDGKKFSVGDSVTVPCTVISITGMGPQAQVTSAVVSQAPVGAKPATPTVTTTTIKHTAGVAVVKKKH